MMMDNDPGSSRPETGGFKQRTLRIVDAMRSRVGASRRQFAVFTLLLLVACTFWARPAGMLIWHRLRIVTGMPRMAIANEDPKVLAEADTDTPESLDAGREVTLDRALRRDPFHPRVADGGGDGMETDPSSTEPQHRVRHLTRQAASIRLSGTSRGLGSAVIDGRVRAVGDEFEIDGTAYRLLEVRSGSVLLDAFLADGQDGLRFLVDREGATFVPSD